MIIFSRLFDAADEGFIRVATFRVRPREKENEQRKITKLEDIIRWYFKNIALKKSPYFTVILAGHSQRDWWNLLWRGIGRNHQRCKFLQCKLSPSIENDCELSPYHIINISCHHNLLHCPCHHHSPIEDENTNTKHRQLNWL